MPASPVSPQYRYTRDEQQLSQLFRAIDGVTTRLAARYALVGGELLKDVVFHSDSKGVITEIDRDAPADDARPRGVPNIYSSLDPKNSPRSQRPRTRTSRAKPPPHPRAH